MKRVALLVFFAVISACGGDSDSSDANVRILHNSPDAPAVDALVDGERVVEGATFPNATGYIPVEAGARRVSVAPTNTETFVIDSTLRLEADTRYTVAAVNKVASIEPLLLVDETSPPSSGKAKVRVVHGAPSAPAVDVYVTPPGAPLNQPTLRGVLFKQFSDYLEIDAGTYQVRVTPTGTKTVAIDSGDLTVPDGAILTAIARDTVGGGAPFGLILLDDKE